MERNLSNGHSEGPENTSSYMLFSYWHVIVIFLGLVGNIFVLVVFNKDPLKQRSSSPWYLSLSSSALISTISYITTYVKSVQNDTKDNAIFQCKLALFMEVIGYTTYSFMIMVTVVRSAVKTWRLIKPTSPCPPHINFRKVSFIVLLCLWVTCIVLGVIPAWVLKDAVTSKDRISCKFEWTDETGSVTWNRLLLTIVVVYTPALITLTATLATNRIQKQILSSESSTNVLQNRYISQNRCNRLHRTLALFFFLSLIPCHTASLILAVTNPPSLHSKTMLVLELISQCYVVYGPFVFVVMSRSYRGIVGRILSCSPNQVTPGTANVSNTNSNASRPTGTSSSTGNRVEQHRNVQVSNRGRR